MPFFSILFSYSGSFVNDDAARLFAASFYESLLSGDTILESFEVAKLHIKHEFPHHDNDDEKDREIPEFEKFLLLPLNVDHKKTVLPARQPKLVLSSKTSVNFQNDSPIIPRSTHCRHTSVFVGRELLVVDIYKHLHRDPNKVVVLWGVSQIGKTEVTDG